MQLQVSALYYSPYSYTVSMVTAYTVCVKILFREETHVVFNIVKNMEDRERISLQGWGSIPFSSMWAVLFF